MYDLILRDGLFIASQGDVRGDLAVEGGVIVALGDVDGTAREVIDLGGRAVLPGGVDTHVHFRTPGHTHKETWRTATRSAVVGGITSVVDMPNTQPPTTDAERLREKLALAAGESRCHYGLFMGATNDNLDAIRRLEDSDLPWCGTKVFMGASTGPLLVDAPGALEALFQHTRRIIVAHAEDNRVLLAAGAPYAGVDDPRVHPLARPPEAAVVAVRRLLELSSAYDHPAHVCHLSTRAELALLTGDPVYAGHRVSSEACPHHLAFDASRLATHGNYAKMNPSLRAPEDREALWEAVAAGRVDFVATDHAPHLPEEKEQPYPTAPAGVPGVETSMRYMLHEGRRRGLGLRAIAELMATRAARRFGIVGKGEIAVGADADLVVVSDAPSAPYQRAEVLSQCGWSPFEGELLAAPPHAVFVAGRQVAAAGRVVDDDVRGRPLRFAAGG